MSLFAGQNKHLGEKIQRVRGFVEHVGLYVGLAVYTLAGAKIFQVIENPAELEKLEVFQALLISKRTLFLNSVRNESINSVNYRERVDLLLSDYEEVAAQAVDNGIDLTTQEFTANWNYIQSVFFSTTILTTIGYGNIAPDTFAGRLFCILFAIIGIPFTLSVIADVGQIFATIVSVLLAKYREKIRPVLLKFNIINEKTEEEDEDGGMGSNIFLVGGAVVFLAVFLSCGAFLFTLWEDWSFFDAFYFCFITFTTIGFGDIVPDITTQRTGYMLVCIIYILVGMALTTTIIELVRRQYAESWRKMQELRAQIQAQLKLADTLKKLGEQADKNGLELDLDIAGDMAALKKNLAKFKRGKHGAGLDDIDIEELDWVENNKKVKAVTILIYETAL